MVVCLPNIFSPKCKAKRVYLEIRKYEVTIAHPRGEPPNPRGTHFAGHSNMSSHCRYAVFRVMAIRSMKKTNMQKNLYLVTSETRKRLLLPVPLNLFRPLEREVQSARRDRRCALELKNASSLNGRRRWSLAHLQPSDKDRNSSDQLLVTESHGDLIETLCKDIGIGYSASDPSADVLITKFVDDTDAMLLGAPH